MPLKTNANTIISGHLTARLKSIEQCTGGDVIVLNVPIRYGIDIIVREAIESLEDRKRKISVILETGGGYIEVTQRIAHTIRHHYKVVDFIVPNCAYSAGTVLVMSGDSIFMDYFAVLGPIDPQLPKDDKMVPALGYLEQYERLVDKSRKGSLTTAELAYLINRFDPAELYMYEQARELSISLLKEWLVKYKFKNWRKTKTRRLKVTKAMKIKRAEEIAKSLNKIDKWNSHGRGIPMNVLQNDLNLQIEDFGANAKLNGCIRDYHRLLQDYLATIRSQFVIHTREGFWRLG
jgi:membrane-bound ClpP family serine protease